jgi:hypothetical protein
MPRYRLSMKQERFAKFVFSAIVVAVTAYWLWFIFTYADKIFRNGRPGFPPSQSTIFRPEAIEFADLAASHFG